MAITFACACGKAYSMRDDQAGKRFRCPKCLAMTQVPVSQASPPPLPAGAGTAPSTADPRVAIACPKCGRRGRLDPSTLPTMIRCPRCQTSWQVAAPMPSLSPSPPPFQSVPPPLSVHTAPPSLPVDLGINASGRAPRRRRARQLFSPTGIATILSLGFASLIVIYAVSLGMRKEPDAPNPAPPPAAANVIPGEAEAQKQAAFELLFLLVTALEHFSVPLTALLLPMILSRAGVFSVGRWVVAFVLCLFLYGALVFFSFMLGFSPGHQDLARSLGKLVGASFFVFIAAATGCLVAALVYPKRN